MKKSTLAAVVVVSALIMLLGQLIFNGFNFAGLDWQRLVVNSLVVDVAVYLGFAFGKKDDNDKK